MAINESLSLVFTSFSAFATSDVVALQDQFLKLALQQIVHSQNHQGDVSFAKE